MKLDEVKVTQTPARKALDNAHGFLEEASDAMKARATLRDQPSGERSMAKTVATFNALTGQNLSEAEGWEFMVLLKMVRGRQGNYNRDDFVDGAAYFGLLGECKSGVTQ
jgi:hypothetical protein